MCERAREKEREGKKWTCTKERNGDNGNDFALFVSVLFFSFLSFMFAFINITKTLHAHLVEAPLGVPQDDPSYSQEAQGQSMNLYMEVLPLGH